MKKYISVIFLVFTNVCFSQLSPFEKGYKEGYKDGYCYEDVGCITPIQPVTPSLKINESISNYKDGYNRGFLDGRKLKEDKTKNKNNTSNTNDTKREWVKTEYQSMFDDDFLKMYMQQLEIRKQQQNQALERKNQDKRIEEERAIKRTKDFTSQTLNFYNEFKDKPQIILDGWHNVVALNQIDFCENQLVRVENNQIVEYYKKPFKWENQKTELKILIGGKIDAGKSLVKTLPFVRENNLQPDYFEVYFIDYSVNKTSRADPPIKTGKISFWTDIKRGNEITVVLLKTRDDYSRGKINVCFKEAPECDEEGTLTFEAEPGEYDFGASDGKSTWRRKLLVTSGECVTHKITKK